MVAKSTLECYRKHQDSICGSRLYDNGIGSSLLFEARAGALHTLEYHRKFGGAVASNLCRFWSVESEKQEHLFLRCKSPNCSGGGRNPPTGAQVSNDR
ncbi:hypothetical protein MRX96_001680 [Rhipicephalus microplus]